MQMTATFISTVTEAAFCLFLALLPVGKEEKQPEMDSKHVDQVNHVPTKKSCLLCPFFGVGVGGYFYDWIVGRWFVDMNRGLDSTRHANEAT